MSPEYVREREPGVDQLAFVIHCRGDSDGDNWRYLGFGIGCARTSGKEETATTTAIVVNAAVTTEVRMASPSD